MISDVRVLTIRQPHASLVAAGIKTIETRSWPTKYRGRLIVHAAARPPFLIEGTELAALAVRAGWPDLPLGAVVASAMLVDCVPMIDYWPSATRGSRQYLDTPCLYAGNKWPLTLWRKGGGADRGEDLEDQLPFGDFTPGRYAWIFEDVQPTTTRCPRCWGSALVPGHDIDGVSTGICCETCEGQGFCPPVPMRGRQGLFKPEWAS